MKINELAVTAAGIIFDNEGNYGSVNKNDNGAVSVEAQIGRRVSLPQQRRQS